MVNDFERLLATIVESVLERDENVILGPVTEHDFNDGVRLAVDFTYDKATPAIALEVTTVQDDELLRTHSSASRLEDRLSEIATYEDLGSWHVYIYDDAKVRQLEAIVRDVLRGGVDITVNDYSSDDLVRWKNAGVLQQQQDLHRELSREALRIVLGGMSRDRLSDGLSARCLLDRLGRA